MQSQTQQLHLTYMKARFSLFVLLAVFASALNAQEDDHDHSGGHESHHKNEIGVANAPIYFVKEKEFSYGLHLLLYI